jgi:hypothetical protein
VQLLGDATVSVVVGGTYADAGAQASDPQDGDVTARIDVANPVDVAVIGTYTVRYEVTDLSGNSAIPVTRTVQVQAREGEGGGGGGGAGLGFLALLTLGIVTRLKRGSRLDFTETARRPGRRFRGNLSL